jgi:hypothetical protein
MKKIVLGFLFIAIFSLIAVAAYQRPVQAAEMTCDEIMVESYGFTFASLLYNTHMVLGLTADAFANKAIDLQLATQIVTEQQGFLESMVSYAEQVAAAPSFQGSETLPKMTDSARQLSKMADALAAYLSDASEENLANYNTARQESSDSIDVLMGK